MCVGEPEQATKGSPLPEVCRWRRQRNLGAERWSCMVPYQENSQEFPTHRHPHEGVCVCVCVSRFKENPQGREPGSR